MNDAAPAAVTRRGGMSWLWNRQLQTYPDTGPRLAYLGITVIATVMLYYELYVGGSVSTLQLANLHMSFTFYVTILAFGNLVGAFGSLFAGLADRVGRTNLVVAGLIVTAILVAFVIPAATDKWVFAIEGWVVGLVEGICLVATPALIRDFSPQVGRATAMGFWTSGPVLGSLVVSVVGAHTIGLHTNWQHEYRICGVAGLVVAAIALVGLRELSPGLRDQLMVSMHDRALIEARAKGIDIEASLRNPFGQLLKADVIVSALGVSLLLLAYYTAVGFGVIYFATIFNTSLKDANGLGNWNWGFNVIAVILVGVVSDRVRVRKPFMVVGGVGAAIMMVLYLSRAGHATSYYHLAILVALLSFFTGLAYTPWMASFTETVEDHNPALTATGLAIWGWIIRVVVFVAFLIIPHVINSVSPLVNYGTQVKALVAQYPAATLPPSLLASLAANPTPAALAQAHQLLGPNYVQDLLALKAAPPNVATYLNAHGAQVAKAAKDSPGQWRTWYWICFGGMVAFLGCIPLLRGRWSPKAAKADELAHAALVDAELAKLGHGSP
jgi:MFS family permease